MLRKIDKSGRVTIPKAYLRSLGIEDEVELGLRTGSVSLRRPIYGCFYCNVGVGLTKKDGIHICRNCEEGIRQAEEKGSKFYAVKID
jgi:bifunctional DNA-binding transcriptional regulator/antitoxin component of YhaV-PrlF toxin-antitoxin module